jgi:hypothetical protein
MAAAFALLPHSQPHAGRSSTLHARTHIQQRRPSNVRQAAVVLGSLQRRFLASTGAHAVRRAARKLIPATTLSESH